MNDFFKSALAKGVGTVLASICLVVLGVVGSSVASTHFPSTEYVDQKVNTSHDKIREEMRIEDKKMREEFKEGIELIASEFKSTNESFAKEVSRTTEEFTTAVKELKTTQSEIIIDKAIIKRDIGFNEKRIQEGKNQREELEERLRNVENKGAGIS